jgi:protein required for attachment to host cells
MKPQRKPNWILIANSVHARLLQQENGGPVLVLKNFTHPQSRSKVSELVNDRAGHESTDRSYGGTSYQPRTDPKKKEHERFARELAVDLERHAQTGAFETLVIFASSPFLGELKAELGPAAARLLTGTHDVDLTSVGPAELKRRIAHELAA